MKPIQRGIGLFSMMIPCVLLPFFFFLHQLVLMLVVGIGAIALFSVAHGPIERKRKKNEHNITIPWYTHSSLFFALGCGLLAVTFLVTQIAINLNNFFTSSMTFSPEIPSWYARFFQIMTRMSMICLLIAALSAIYYSLWFQYKVYDWKHARAEKKRRRLPSSAEDDPE